MCSSRFPLTATVVLLVSLSAVVVVVQSFNLEPRIPVVKIGSPKSHFGYSVAQHQSVLDTFSSRKRITPWILVGAPKDHNLQPGTRRSGALWKCPFTTNSSDCVQVHTDGFKDPGTGLYDFEYANENLLPPNDDEIKDDQWLGVTVKSQGSGGDVLVCAHRYMHRGPGFQWGFGLCYLLNQHLDVTDSMEPCRGKAVAKGHQQYGFCQAGMSGLILKDEVVLGLPGPYTWRGTVHTSNISKNFLFRDKTQYFGPVTENDSPVDKYSYLGYSVTAGRFLGDFVSYVGGAPRSNGTGQVVFFSRDNIGESLLLVDLVLNGETFASSFGFEVLGVDINNDNFDDLVVGAPFYYSKHSSGAVYVYINNRHGIKRDHAFTKIEGPPGETRFGFSMTSLGDLNRDGYKDIAIGAPYEERGAIYIYLGSRDGLVKEPSQIIRASDLPGPTYDAFGYALSGGLDMDNNGYPDLLTSSFCSDRVVLIRARPVINIQTIVAPEGGPRNIDPTRIGCPDDPDAKETCFSFDACFRMDNDAGTRTGLLLQYSIEERVYRDQPLPRVHFVKDAQQQPSSVTRKINLRPEDMGRPQCTREVAYLKSGSRDLLRPLRFKLNYEIIQREPQPVQDGGPMPNVDDFPILDQQEAVKYFEGHFVKDCGDDDKCDSDLSTEAFLRLPWDNSKSHQVFELGRRNMAVLETSVDNAGEPAYEPNLYIKHHDSMAFSVKDSDTGLYQCVPARGDLVHCTLGNPLTNGTGPMHLAFKPSGFFDKRFIHFKIFANSTSNELTPEKPIDLVLEILKRAEISIAGSVEPEQVFFSGDVIGESGVNAIEEIGAEVIHKYVVDNRGPWRVDYVDVEILWPHQVENNQPQGKWLLYLTDVPTVDGDGECEVDPSYVNPVQLPSRRSPFYSPFGGVSGEVETGGYKKPVEQPSVDPSEAPNEIVPGVVSSQSKNTTTITKKVTSSSTINTVRSETSKSSSSKDVTDTSRSSSSTHGSTHESYGSGDYDYDYDDYPDHRDNPNYPGRGGSRTHSRVSRRVYSTRTDNRGAFGANEIDGDSKQPSGSTRSEVTYRRTNTGGSVDREGMWPEGDQDRTGEWSSRTYTSTRGGNANSNFIDGDETEDSWRTRGEDDSAPAGSSRQGSVYSSSKRVKTSRTYTTSDNSDADSRLSSHDDRSRFDDRSGFSDRIGTVDSNPDEDTNWETRTYDSGRGREERRRTSKTYTNEDGARTQEERDELRRTHTTSELGPDVDDGRRGGSYKRTEQSRKVHTSRVSSNSFDLDGTDDRPDRFITSDRNSIGNRQSFYDDRTRQPDRDTTYDRDGNWETRTYDGGRGREERRRTSKTFTDDDGARNTEDRSEVRHHYSSNNLNPEWNDRNLNGSYKKTQHSKRVYTTRVSSSSDGQDESDASFNRVDSRGAADRYPDERRQVDWADPNYRGRSRDRTQTYDANIDSRGSAGNGDYHSSRTYNRNNLDNTNDSFDSRDRYSSSATSSRGSYSPYDGSRYSSSSTRTFYGSEDGQSRPDSRWNSGGFRSVHDRDGGDSESRGASDRSGWSSSTRQGSGRDSDSGHVSGSWSSGDSSRQSNSDGSQGRSSWSHSTSAGGHDDGSGDDRNTWSSRGSWSSSHGGGGGSSSRRSSSAGSGHDSWPHSDDDTYYQYSDYSNEHDGNHGRSKSGGGGGVTYTKTVVDDKTGEARVYSRKVFDDYTTEWKEVDPSAPLSTGSSRDGLFANSDNDQLRHSLRRVKRDKEMVVQPEAYTDDQTGKTLQVVNLRCSGDTPTAKCIPIRCTIRNLGADSSASIRVASRLWNATLVEDYAHVNLVNIESRGELLLPEDIRYRQDQSDDVATAETKAYANLLEQSKAVPLWVILVSIFAGLLLLALIILLLWKLGFFERKRPDPTLSGNLAKNGY